MKTLLKIVIAGVVVNGLYRAGDAAWRYYELKDSAYQVLLFGADAPPERLQEQIVRRAAALKLPVSSEQVTVSRDGARSEARVSYHTDIEIFPRYRVPYDFSFDVSAVAIR